MSFTSVPKEFLYLNKKRAISEAIVNLHVIFKITRKMLLSAKNCNPIGQKLWKL